VIFVHEVHDIAGRDEDAFDIALRDTWAPAVAESGDARLVWACRQAHGTGPSYRVVTYTAVRSAAAWSDLAERAAGGDLRGTVEGLDRHRHGVTATLLRPVSWSPLQELDLDAIPADPPAEARSTLFMEDTAWPFRERLEDYLAQAGQLYAGMLAEGAERGTSLLEMVAAFQPLWGTGPWRQVVLWQRVTAPDRLLAMLQTEVPPKYRAPGTWMHDALELRDQWESRLLRTLPWSPLT
jgi:hypothetical protein